MKVSEIPESLRGYRYPEDLTGNSIRVIFWKSGWIPVLGEIQNTLETFQKYVDGPIEVSRIKGIEGVGVVCNEEGKLRGLRPSFNNLYNDIICGDSVLCGLGEEDFIDLTDEQIEKIYEFVIDTVTFSVPEDAPEYVESEESGLHGGKEDELT